jgi:hypothetical protein
MIRAAPLDRRLDGIHLCANSRMQTVCGNQQSAVAFEVTAVPRFDQRRDATLPVSVTSDALAQTDRIGAEPLEHGAVQQHLELAAVHCVLRPAVAGEQAARLGVDVVAVAADQRPFAGLDADAVQHLAADAEVIELANGVGLQVDADAERLRIGDGLVHHARHADLVKRERESHAADAASGDQDGLRSG